MEPRFEQFIQEKNYLANVSPATCEWYKQSLNWLPGPSPDEAALKDFVMRMRAKGLTASSCNCHIRAVNSYLHWASGKNPKCCSACSHLKVQKLKKSSGFCPHSQTMIFTK
jgi:integrase/recombinase XerD